MLEYCHKKNIPFCENEKRFYDVMKSKQNHKYWVENWKKYCNLNIVDPPPKKPVEIPQNNNFLRALMAMAKRKKEASAAAQSS